MARLSAKLAVLQQTALVEVRLKSQPAGGRRPTVAGEALRRGALHEQGRQGPQWMFLEQIARRAPDEALVPDQRRAP